MTALGKLTRAFSAAARRLEAHRPELAELAGLERLKHINAELQARIDGPGLASSEDRVVAALQRFHGSWAFSGPRDGRLICSQIHVPKLGSEDAPIRPIEDATWFENITRNVDAFGPNNRAFRGCYRGLLTGYLECDPEDASLREAGRKNWNTLQGFLRDRVDWLHVNAYDPAWVGALFEHRNILDQDPCGRYARAALAGNTQEWDRLQAAFNLGGRTWLARRFVEAQVRAAVDSEDPEFLRLVPVILDLIGRSENTSLFDQSLARLLDRYRRVTPRPIHPVLRDRSTERWSSPILVSNRGKWSRVQDATREMVADWIKLETIQQFFEFLAEEGATDKRRVRYWEQRYRQIEQFWLVLGDDAMRKNDVDFRKLRDGMKRDGLLKSLLRDRENNAIIMKIGQLLVVEFSKTGNACYAYDLSMQAPFDLDRSSFPTLALKLPSQAVGRLSHTHDWEFRFDQFLAQQGIGKPTPNAHFGAEDGASGSRRETVERKLEAFSAERLELLIKGSGLTRVGNQSIGANLIQLSGPDVHESVARQLRAWGFKYSKRYGWWREN